MKDDVMEFIEKNKQPRSILDNYFDEILAMKKADLSYKLIVEYLATKGVKTSIQNVSSYYKRRTEKKKKTITDKKTTTSDDAPQEIPSKNKPLTPDDLLGNLQSRMKKKAMFDIPTIQKKGWQD